VADAVAMQGEPELRNVFFRYSETERLALENVNLKLRTESFMMVVDRSGGGKIMLPRLI
jgi:ABC-type bacteriocin/lantibiotic exporter with double-glycine peptidase domain